MSVSDVYICHTCNSATEHHADGTCFGCGKVEHPAPEPATSLPAVGSLRIGAELAEAGSLPNGPSEDTPPLRNERLAKREAEPPHTPKQFRCKCGFEGTLDQCTAHIVDGDCEEAEPPPQPQARWPEVAPCGCVVNSVQIGNMDRFFINSTECKYSASLSVSLQLTKEEVLRAGNPAFGGEWKPSFSEKMRQDWLLMYAGARCNQCTSAVRRGTHIADCHCDCHAALSQGQPEAQGFDDGVEAAIQYVRDLNWQDTATRAWIVRMMERALKRSSQPAGESEKER